MTARSGPLGILELGTNSVKLHRFSRDRERHEPVRLEWEVGFDICSTGRLSEENVADALDQIRKCLDRCQLDDVEALFGVATGVFEEADNVAELLERLDVELDIPVRVLTGLEQAQLLYLGFLDRVHRRPGMIFDLGCGRLEMVYLGVGEEKKYLHESLPLGVIRIHHVASFLSGVFDEESAVRYVQVKLEEAKGFDLREIHGTGGTIRVISQLAGMSTLTRDVLVRVEDEVRTHGPPPFLSPRRQAIILPGLIMARLLMEHVNATVVQHHRVDLGLVLMERLQPFYAAMGNRLRELFINREVDILKW